MSDIIKVRVDEWCEKVEVTSEGVFLYLERDIVDEVICLLEDGCCD